MVHFLYQLTKRGSVFLSFPSCSLSILCVGNLPNLLDITMPFVGLHFLLLLTLSSFNALAFSNETLDSSQISNVSEVTGSVNASTQNIVETECFPRGYFTAEPSGQDCIRAAKDYRENPSYKEVVTYCNTEGCKGVLTPLPFHYRTCSIIVDADDPTEDSFSLESGWPSVSALIKNCILDRKPGNRHGGTSNIGNGKGFYITLSPRPVQLIQETTE